MKNYNNTQTDTKDADQQEKQGSKIGQTGHENRQTNDMNQDKSQVHTTGL